MRAQEDELYMRMALDEACAAAREGEVPIGAEAQSWCTRRRMTPQATST